MNRTFYRRTLPHWQPVGATFFVTFRLKDSLPIPILKKLRAEFEAACHQVKTQAPANLPFLLHTERIRYFGRFEDWLDRCSYGPNYLENPVIAQLVIDQIHALDGQWYNLEAYCVMPNHVHLLIDTSLQLLDTDDNYDYTEYIQLERIMKQIKGSTGFTANRILGRHGKFWQKESFDHWIRNEREWRNIVQYILNNPVKAGLVNEWAAWPYTFCKYS